MIARIYFMAVQEFRLESFEIPDTIKQARLMFLIARIYFMAVQEFRLGSFEIHDTIKFTPTNLPRNNYHLHRIHRTCCHQEDPQQQNPDLSDSDSQPVEHYKHHDDLLYTGLHTLLQYTLQ